MSRSPDHPAAGAVSAAQPEWQALVDSWLNAPQNAEARRAFVADTPTLNPLQERLLGDLRERGVTHVALTDLVEDPSQWDVLAQDIRVLLHTPAVREAEAAFHALDPAKRGKDDYIFRHYRRQGEPATLPWTCPWLQTALDRRILDVANHYFMLMSHLYHLDLWVTFPDARDSPRVSAQNWHRDKMDLRLLKAFLYFSDVDLDSGALQYVPDSRRGDEKFGHLWNDGQRRSGYAPADEFDRRIPEADWVSCAHPAGTLVLVDTTGFHRGGRARTRKRVFATWAYGSQLVKTDRFVIDPESVPIELPAASRFALFRSA